MWKCKKSAGGNAQVTVECPEVNVAVLTSMDDPEAEQQAAEEWAGIRVAGTLIEISDPIPPFHPR
jgi:hypothetical protein